MSSTVDLSMQNVEILARDHSSVEGDNNFEVANPIDFSPVGLHKLFINKKIIFESSPVYKENAESYINLAKLELFSSSKESFENYGAEIMESVCASTKSEETFEGYGIGALSDVNGNQDCIIQQLDVREGLKRFFETCLPDKDGLVSKEDIVIKFEDKFKECIPKDYLDIVKETVMLGNADEINFETFYSALKSWIENILMNKTCSISSPERHVLNFKLIDTPVLKEDSDFEDFLTDSGYKPFCIVQDDPNRRSTLRSDKIIQRINSNDDYPLPSPIREPEDENSENEQPNRTLCPDLKENFDFTVGSIETDSNVTPLDPIELKDEVLELTYANKRLMQERDILSAQNTQADISQATLRKKCENLENSLANAQAQMRRLRDVEEENQKLKIEISEQIQLNCELEATLTSSQECHENLLKNFESLKKEAEAVTEKLEQALQEKEKLSARLVECLNEVNKLNECNGTICEKLNLKDVKIENLSKTVLCLETEIEKLQSENCNLMGELHQLKDDHRLSDIHEAFRTEIAMASDSLFEEDDYSREEKSSDSTSSSLTKSSSETKVKETTSASTPVNIRDEICSLEASDAQSALPFCEKDDSSLSSTSTQTMMTLLHKSLSKWKHWKKKSINFAEDLHSNGSLDDEAQSLLESHMDELISLTKKWRSFLNIRIECEYKSCKKVISPEERFSLTSWSSLEEWESQRDGSAPESKYKNEVEQIAEQSTLILLSDPSRDITDDKDSKIEDVVSLPSIKETSSFLRIQDVYDENINVSSTSAKEDKGCQKMFSDKRDFFRKCLKEDDKILTTPAIVPSEATPAVVLSEDEALVSSSTDSSILYHDLPVTPDSVKRPKTSEEKKFYSSSFSRGSPSIQSPLRVSEGVSRSSPRSRKSLLIVIGILSIILSICSFLSFLLMREAHKGCYNNPHLRNPVSWVPFVHIKYSGEPPY